MALRAWRISPGSGSAAVTVCGPACILMVRQRRAVVTNLRIDQPVSAPGHSQTRITTPAADRDGGSPYWPVW